MGFYVLFFAVIIVSCVNVKNKKEVKEIHINIVLTDRIAQSVTDKLPEQIDSLFMPIEPSACPKIAYLPNVEIIRYGLPREYHKIIKTDGEGWKTFFQKFYGNTGVETRKTNINNALGKFALGDSLVMENSKDFLPGQTIEKVLSSNPASQFFFYNSEVNFASYKSGNKDIVIYTNVKALISAIGNQLCEKPGEANQKIVIFYNPKLNNTVDSIPIPYLTVMPQSKNVKKEAGELIFKVSSNVEWKVKSNKTWCVPNATNGNDSLIVKYYENKGSEKRLAELLITGTGILKQTVIISQEGKNPPPPPPIPHPESLEEYFKKIADKSITYNRKGDLKKEIITKYFENENAQVVEKGDNGTEVSRTSIKDYVEVLSLQYYKIKILDKETNDSKKITTLYIREL